jgi:hypothetical protein
MKIATIRLDLVKTVFQVHGAIRRDISSYPDNCVALMCYRFREA